MVYVQQEIIQILLIRGLTSWIGVKSCPFHTKPHYLVSLSVEGDSAASNMTSGKGEQVAAGRTGVKKTGVPRHLFLSST